MPLTKGTVTEASKIMLPAYVVLATFLGLLYVVDPYGRLRRAPGLSLARELAPMPVWGCMFLAVAALMTVALILHRRNLFVFALYACGAVCLLWAGIYAGAVALSDQASFGAPAWPLLAAVACHASARSLMRREV